MRYVHGELINGVITAEYRSWSHARSRCFNHSNAKYDLYGGRGISMCAQWADYSQFLKDMGRRTSAACSLDRINVNGDYEPGNCRWATQKEQQRNRRNNRMITIDGENLSLATWCERVGLRYKTVFARLKRGWPAERALEIV